MERGRRRALEFWQQVLSCFRGQKSAAQEAHFGHFYLSVASLAAQGASNRPEDPPLISFLRDHPKAPLVR